MKVILDVVNIAHLPESMGIFQVRKFSDIMERIIPFFQNNKIEGEKFKDFNGWCKAGYLIKDKQHLTK